jgi:DMSO/TMAO reductase YedYZ molybdopterin-dependent catalytic subunit
MIRRRLLPSNWFRCAGRRTNVALLLLLMAAGMTGVLAFSAGMPVPARLATVAHGVAGFAVVLLVPWKTVIVRRARMLRAVSLTLVVLLALCVASGFVEVFLGYGVLAGLSPMQVHVGSAALATPLLAWHVLRHRRQRLRRVDMSRRMLVRTGVLAGAAAATYGIFEGVGRLAGSAAAGRAETGSHGIDANVVPATIWLFDQVPVVAEDHRVKVAGTALSVLDLQARSTTVRARLDCTSGWYTDAEWTAVSLADLLPADELAEAASIEVVSLTGYRRRFPAGEAGSLWLATAYQGEPLRPAHGAPVRLVAPHRRGFWWVKWVAWVELSEVPAWGQSPFPLQ